MLFIHYEIRLLIVPSWKCESRGLNLCIQGVLRTTCHRTLAKCFNSTRGKSIYFISL